MPDPDLLRAFNFRVRLVRAAQAGPPRPRTGAKPKPSLALAGTPLVDGGFAECTGLDVDVDLQEINEGGRNDRTIRRLGRLRTSNIVLKRGMVVPAAPGVADGRLWSWVLGVVAGSRPVARYDGIIEVLGPAGGQLAPALATWRFTRGLPAKISGPRLDARTGEIALEELHIAPERLWLDVGAGQGAVT